MRGGHTVLLFGLVGLFVGLDLANASPLNLSRYHYPLVYSTGIYVGYDPNGAGVGRGLLTAWGYPAIVQGWPDANDPNTVLDLGYTSWLSLQLEIDPGTGEFVATSDYNDLYICGDPIDPGPDGGDIDLFVSSKATAFGVLGGGHDVFELLFEQESGELAPAGAPVGIILYGNSIAEFDESNPPVFNSPFENNYNGEVDSFYLPEPTTALFLAIAGLGIACRRRRCLHS